jgi:hypothetical protein
MACVPAASFAATALTDLLLERITMNLPIQDYVLNLSQPSASSETVGVDLSSVQEQPHVLQEAKARRHKMM